MSDPNQGPVEFFTGDHRDCDELYTALESALDSGDVSRAKDAWAKFEHAMQRHFAMEEEILFPMLEEAAGMHGFGPTVVMRQEHQQMKGLLHQMSGAMAGGDLSRVLDTGDTLLMVIQQHNLKEENILYPMAEQALSGPKWSPIAERLAVMCS